MDKTVFDVPFVNNKNTGHLETITQLQTDAMPIHYAGGKAPDPGLQAKELVEVSFGEAKSCVIGTGRVTDMLGPLQAVPLKVAISDFIIGHMHEDNIGTFLFYGLPLFGNIRQGLPAKGTSEMSQKDQHDRLTIRQILEGIALICDHSGNGRQIDLQ
jgi:hypothetical protein